MEQTKAPSEAKKPQKKQKEKTEAKPQGDKPVYETTKVKRQQYRFKNVFDAAVRQHDEIVDTYLSQAEKALISDERLSHILANPRDISHFAPNEQAFAQQFRSFSEECKLDPSFMVVDYSIKSGRTEEEVDSSYAAQKQDASVWTNIREGNTLLESYDPKDFSKLLSVSMIRQGLPKFFKLHLEAIG